MRLWRASACIREGVCYVTHATSCAVWPVCYRLEAVEFRSRPAGADPGLDIAVREQHAGTCQVRYDISAVAVGTAARDVLFPTEPGFAGSGGLPRV